MSIPKLSRINHPLVNGVIAFDKRSFSSQSSVSSPSSDSQPAITTIKVGDASVSGDSYYYDFLNGKVKLTELGMYILNTIKTNQLEQTKSSDELKNKTFFGLSNLEFNNAIWLKAL